MCFPRCSFPIKTVPLGHNWCYLRLGWSHMGGEREVRLRWYRGRGDRKPLCNLVRLEIEAAIKLTGLNSACLLLLCSFRASELNCHELLSWLFPQEPGFHLGVYMLEYFQLCIFRKIESYGFDQCVQRVYLKRYVVRLYQISGGRIIFVPYTVGKQPI